MKKKIIIGVVIVVIIGIIGGIRISSKGRKDVTTIKSSKVVIGDVKMYLSTTATIKSKNEKDYSVSATTKISNVKVGVGDKVKKGDTLLTYDTADLNNQVQSAQINYDNAISQKKDAVNNNNDANVTIANTADTSVNAARISAAKASVLSNEKIKQLNNAIKSAETTLDSTKIKLSQNSDITSDIVGVVTEVNVISGQTGAQDRKSVV